LETLSNDLFTETDADGSGFVEGDELTNLMDKMATILEIPAPKPDQIQKLLV
jgi:hypothetical protein